MPNLTGPPRAFSFPDRCVECGAPPTRSYALALPRGAGTSAAALAAPLCDHHAERKSLGQAAWVAAAALAGIALMVAGAVVLDALTPSFPAMRRLTGVFVVVLLAAAALPVWLAARRGRRGYHRRFSAVWVEAPPPAGAPPEAGAVTLGFRAADLCRDVAVASGLAAGPAAPFRAPGAAPDPFVPPKNPIPAWAIAAFGLAVIPAGIAEYVSLGRAEARGETISRIWIEIVVYELFGRVGVLALFAAVGVLSFTFGALLFRQAQRRSHRAP